MMLPKMNGTWLRTFQKCIKKLPYETLYSTNQTVFSTALLSCIPEIKQEHLAPDVIETTCLSYLTAAGVYNEHGELSFPYDREQTSVSNDILGHFITHLAGFYQLPGITLLHLRSQVQKDFDEISDFINEIYTRDPYILQYLQDRLIQNPQKRLRVDFYHRCLTEQELIKKYLEVNINIAAFRKSQVDHNDKKLFDVAYADFIYRPYRWAYQGNRPYFNYNEIDQCQHRFDLEYLREERKELIALYKAGNKADFYRLIRERMPPDMIFNGISNYYLCVLPQLQKRKTIFAELKVLFQQEFWIGFSALALLQLEGLLTDIGKLIKKRKKAKSLPDKVLSLRESMEGSHRLDYFEYVLPGIRNSIAHTGYTNDSAWWVLAHELLYDINGLLRLLNEHGDPLLQLHKFIVKDDLRCLHDLNQFNELLTWVQAAYNAKMDKPDNSEVVEIWQQWLNFQKEGDLGENLEEFINTWFTSIKLEVDRASEFLNEELAANRSAINIDLTNELPPLSGKLRNELIDIIKESENYHLIRGLKCVYQAINNLRNYNNWFPALPTSISIELSKNKLQYKTLGRFLESIKESFM